MTVKNLYYIKKGKQKIKIKRIISVLLVLVFAAAAFVGRGTSGEEKSLVYYYVNTLDDKGRTIESVTESEFIHMKEVTEYSGGNKVKDIAYVKDKPEDEWEQRYTYSYTYDNDGKLIETVSDYPNGDVEKTVNEYTAGKLAKSTAYIKESGAADFVISSYEVYEY